MDKDELLGVVFVVVIGIIILIVVLVRSNLINFIVRLFVRTKKNELNFFRQYILSRDYSTINKFRRIHIEKVIERFKKNKTSNYINIRSFFNGSHYPFYDLDDDTKLQLFKKIYAATPYVIFQSSKNNFWGIVDLPQKDIKKILTDHNWNICNDSKYVNYSRHHKALCIRGLYKNMDRKPILIKENKNLSKTFRLFVDKLVTYYSKESLEISVIKYQNPEMLIRFNRKRKLKLLNEKEN